MWCCCDNNNGVALFVMKKKSVLVLAAIVTIVTMATMAIGIAVEDPRTNNSNLTGMYYWPSSSSDESSPPVAASAENNYNNEEDDYFDGGFSSLEGMLQWSIGHSDPVKLKEAAQDAQRLSTSDLEKRQLEIKDMMEQLKTPSDAQLMQRAIADLNNSSLPLENHIRALEELLILVESIDNANDMNKFGGLQAVIRELNNSDRHMRIISAWILGMASQNNLVLQNQIISLGALTKLMKMVNSSSVEEATKGLYAVSALIRNNIDGQELFYAKAGEMMLQDIMSSPSKDIRLKKKSVSLVTDLAIHRLESKNETGHSSLSNPFFLKSVVDLTSLSDIDLLERALIAIKSLLQLKSTEALDFRDFCGLDEVLESTREQLHQGMTDQYDRDFLLDLENLLREVETIFQKKLQMINT